MNIKEIEYENKLYPEALRNIKKPPKKLYVLGDETILNNESVAIIGSRNCTEYGVKIAKEFARDLAQNGVTIVSGMAKGIDSAAHIGAIEVKGKTIAVLGSGFNHIFPDKEVFEKILKHGGAVITEYEQNIDVFPQGFRDRNRIVAGLGVGVLVVEAREKSGTGITAEYANQFNRKAFCIPHRIGDDAGVGTNRLIKRGAMLVTEAQDLLPFFENIKSIKKNDTKLQIEIPEEYKIVYDSLQEPLNADEVSKKTKMKIIEVNTILTMLELEGYIESMPGNFFRRK